MTGPRGQIYIPHEHRAAKVLWARVVAAHGARTSGAGEFGIGYLTGFRDGMSEAYSAVTGVSRQAVGDKARSEAAQSGAADMSPGSAAPEIETPEESNDDDIEP